MRVTQAHPGHYWRMDDPANLPLSYAGPDTPTTLTAFKIGSSGLVRPATRDVDIDSLV